MVTFRRWRRKGGVRTRRSNPKIYKTLDNYNNPFTVIVKGKSAKVLITETSKRLLNVKFNNIFIGDNDLKINIAGVAPKGDFPGNSILIETGKGKYIYVGDQVYSFSTGSEKIVAYFSPVGNNQVPYPYAVGEKNTYFLLDKQIIPNELLDLTEDAYPQYYGFTIKDEGMKEVIMKAKRDFKVKMIQKRIIG